VVKPMTPPPRISTSGDGDMKVLYNGEPGA
jgi:hypothetical protein